jgi:peptidoglycan/LPS O-acetylase OafA/YrhL
MTQTFSAFLNASRWIAAFMVVLYHARALVMVPYSDVTRQGQLPTRILYLASALGHEAVMVFFVLSGFLVGGLTLKRWRTRGVEIGNYYAHRFSRIYIVLIPALLVGWGLDSIGVNYLNDTGIYTNSGHFSMIPRRIGTARLTPEVFIANLAMLQGLFSFRTFGSNGPLWSLACEWWYYCIFAAAAAAALCKDILVRALNFAVLIALLFMLAVGSLHFLAWMLIWLLGIAVFWFCESRYRKPNPYVAAVQFIIVLVISAWSHGKLEANATWEPYGSYAMEFSVGLSFCVLLSSFYARGGSAWTGSLLHKKFADFSYSTYVVHLPFLMVLIALFNDKLRIGLLQQPSLTSFGYLVFLVLSVCLCAYGFSVLTERHTDKMRRLLTSCYRMARSKLGSYCDSQSRL